MIYELIVRRRSVRKYTSKAVSRDVLDKCVDAARMSPCGSNRQPLKFLIVTDEPLLRRVFPTTSWAGWLPDYFPTDDEMPRAYIVILLDQTIRDDVGHDAGIAAMSISMVAYDEGLGSCILGGGIDRGALREVLALPQSVAIALVVALGYPAERQVVDAVKAGDIRYWLDEDGVLHVPKRRREDVVMWNRYHRQ
jgi:nitroreductase